MFASVEYLDRSLIQFSKCSLVLLVENFFENIARKNLRDELEKVSFVGFSEMYRLTLLPDLTRIALCSLAPQRFGGRGLPYSLAPLLI